MQSKFVIRPTAHSLAPTLAALHAESFGMECWSLDQIKGSLALATTKAWAGFDGDVPVGFILCQHVRDEAEILTICVNPTRRRQQIGEVLLQHAMEIMRIEGSAKIFLEVAADNLAARNLYEKLGFTVSGTRANYYKRGAVTVDGVMYTQKI